MLPALQLLPKPNEHHTFTRRPEWVRPLESLWSILAKWQFVNRVPYSTIASSILTRSGAAAEHGVDLRLLEHFCMDALAEHSGLSHSMIASAACSPSADSRMIEFASQHLRFCAACMEEGFHAALFQFTPIRRCPIHHRPLNEVCTHCRKKIPYRLDASFAAHPFACPHCAHPLLPDPTALMRQSCTNTVNDTIMNWQLFLATYVYWYAEGRQTLRDDSGRFLDHGKLPASPSMTRRFNFIGALQALLHKPPPLPTFTVDTKFPPWMSPQKVSCATAATPGYLQQDWPQFYSKRFLSLCQRYSRFYNSLQQLTSPREHEITRWWRRSWEGAISRQCDVTTAFTDPPLGITEWAFFSIVPARFLKSGAIQQRMDLRFEHDLRATWQAWNSVITHLDNSSSSALHPYLVPTRACWLTTPAFDPGSPALGFF
jgi:hypothetical protein